ncbi:MAG: nicotinamide-nucleotide amidohydrolase family protein, partial [Actinobacteria bacterium]
LATAESCTGGMVAAALTDIRGSSAAFLGGVVSYADDAKREMLGVPAVTLDANGAVSAAVAEAMAVGAQKRLDADLAVAITGVAGPDGGTPEKPVGLVWFAIADRRDGQQVVVSVERRFPGRSREAIRARATSTALDLVRRRIHGLPVR